LSVEDRVVHELGVGGVKDLAVLILAQEFQDVGLGVVGLVTRDDVLETP